MPNQVYRYIGTRLKELRAERGLTQAQVAQVLSVSPQQYQKYEDASTKCSLIHIYSLAQHYGIAASDILPIRNKTNGEPDPNYHAPEEDTGSDADLVARLVTAFVAIKDAKLRRSLVHVIESAAANGSKNE